MTRRLQLLCRIGFLVGGAAIGLFAQSDYVGDQVCLLCHVEFDQTFLRNAHFRSAATGDLPPERTGCQGCHGPGRQHWESDGDPAFIRKFEDLSPRQVIDTCLKCHQEDFPRANIQRSTHTLADVVCTNCHSIHSSPEPRFLLAKRQVDLCFSCHKGVQAQFAMPFKHRVNEGSIECTDCHNPHGAAAPTWRMGQRPQMVSTALGNEEPCLGCHIDKRGPFAFQHPAVRVDGCETCHSPHGSMNPRMLKRPTVFAVCLECHNGAGDFGRQADGIPTQSSAHNMADPRFRECTSCHVQIHGSNADRRFFR